MNSFDYCAEIAKTSLKASMKTNIEVEPPQSDERILTLNNLREDIEFLNDVKERCAELTVKLANRNVVLFRNKSKNLLYLSKSI